jgi:hypothetical protein
MESMAEILLMMKKQGINVDGYEAEAEDIWNSLETMAEKDPYGYREFIQNQYKESVTETKSSNSAAGSSSIPATATSDKEDRFFRPLPGFSIKTRSSGGDGLKIRAEGDGKEFFINFCSHPIIEAPIDSNGHSIEISQFDRRSSADGLQVAKFHHLFSPVNCCTLSNFAEMIQSLSSRYPC